MKYQLRLRLDAEGDLASARDWYRRESPKAADRFAVEISAAIDAIGQNPAMFPRVHGEIRRAMTRRFPYAIYFLLDQERITILRVLHQARDPETLPKG